MITRILDVLHLGIPVDCENFAKVLVTSICGRVVDYPAANEALDLSDYAEIASVYAEEGEMDIYRHVDGVYRIVGKRITLAVVPHANGVEHYLQKRTKQLGRHHPLRSSHRRERPSSGSRNCQ
jgi:hypothetical protein